MSLLLASEEFALDFPSTRHLSLSGSYPLDLSDLQDPTGSSATAGLAVSVYRNPRASPPGQVGDIMGWVLNTVCVQYVPILQKLIMVSSSHQSGLRVTTEVKKSKQAKIWSLAHK
jgi:hypothetical protein